jgi:hypothetical protein
LTCSRPCSIGIYASAGKPIGIYSIPEISFIGQTEI